jgi:hypothetical protein
VFDAGGVATLFGSTVRFLSGIRPVDGGSNPPAFHSKSYEHISLRPAPDLQQTGPMVARIPYNRWMGAGIAIYTHVLCQPNRWSSQGRSRAQDIVHF